MKLEKLIKNKNIECVDVLYEKNKDGTWKETILKIKRRNDRKEAELQDYLSRSNKVMINNKIY